MGILLRCNNYVMFVAVYIIYVLICCIVLIDIFLHLLFSLNLLCNRFLFFYSLL